MRHLLLGVGAALLAAAALAQTPERPSGAAAKGAAKAPATPAKPAVPKAVDQPTPMAERVATFAVLNKQNGQTRQFAAKPGASVAHGRLTVRVRACEATPPWDRPWTGAFLQIDERLKQGGTKRVFSGWLFAESPSINSFDHPTYDVWVKSCAMSFPEAGPDTIVAGKSAPSDAKPSSAKKSASTAKAAPSEER